MQSFLEEVVAEISGKYPSLENLVFVLPSKRAGTFVRNSLAKTTRKTLFAPEIYSIEDFVGHISGIGYATHTEQLFELYRTYATQAKGEKDSFFAFSKWGQTLLQDFNEIDRHLIDARQLFSNLSAIQEISVWSPEAKKTQMMEDYLSFWNNLEPLYQLFNKSLLGKGIGHQGLVYREACQKLDAYMESSPQKVHIFIGFNALNTAETKIIQTILRDSTGEIFWDIDTYFLEDPIHDAGFFMRNHFKTWEVLKTNPPNGVGSHYLDEKNISVVGVPKNVSQAKYVGQLLRKLHHKDPNLLKNTAVVLGDETLLNPILNSIPAELPDVNITMGYPLDKTPLAGLFIQFIDLYINKDPQGWFYKPILAFLSHPYVQTLLSKDGNNRATLLVEAIKSNNWTHITSHKLNPTVGGDPNISLLFFEGNATPKTLVRQSLAIIMELKDILSESNDRLSMEYLYRFYKLFNQIRELIEEHPFINDAKSLLSLYKELLSSETLDFQGEPLQGLQIMGMLESRNLDFETVVLTSVNEGILPSGKSNNSFIPYDLKKHFALPTYKEKDAVYTYHFYRLLQRAKNIHLLYNTEPDVLEGGEKSRLIRQLLSDENKRGDITEHIAVPDIRPGIKTLEKVEKDSGLMALIQAHAGSGFSPTSLSNYIRNPMDFYKRNLLNIDDVMEVEETVAANTFGTIVHDTLEALYTPFLGQDLSEEHLQKARTNTKSLVKHHFSKNHLDGDTPRGKNLIALKVVERYVENFIDMEIRDVRKHQIRILGLEQKLKRQLKIPGIDFPVFLKGKLDRVDNRDGVTRIIDYKTGKTLPSQVEIVDWTALGTEYEHSKAFQLLCYALMYQDTDPMGELQAGILSFKNLNAGLLPFATKEKRGSRTKNTIIDREVLSKFKSELQTLVLEICNPGIPLIEKEISGQTY